MITDRDRPAALGDDGSQSYAVVQIPVTVGALIMVQFDGLERLGGAWVFRSWLDMLQPCVGMAEIAVHPVPEAMFRREDDKYAGRELLSGLSEHFQRPVHGGPVFRDVLLFQFADLPVQLEFDKLVELGLPYRAGQSIRVAGRIFFPEGLKSLAPCPVV